MTQAPSFSTSILSRPQLLPVEDPYTLHLFRPSQLRALSHDSALADRALLVETLFPYSSRNRAIPQPLDIGPVLTSIRVDGPFRY